MRCTNPALHLNPRSITKCAPLSPLFNFTQAAVIIDETFYSDAAPGRTSFLEAFGISEAEAAAIPALKNSKASQSMPGS